MSSGFATEIRAIKDLQFAEVEGRKLLLDLYLPEGVKNPPLIVSMFGGGWRAGNRNGGLESLQMLIDNGYAVASIDYRLSTEAVFPAQVYDCKGAVRWLRAHASAYGYDTARFAAMGVSSGAYLALFLGLTGDSPALEGTVGGNTNQSSKVIAVVDSCGPTDFLLRSLDQPWETDKQTGKVYQLLGGSVKENQELATLASPAWHVSADDPPVLIFHGTKDATVLINQAERLHDALVQAGVTVEYYPLEGGGHGDPNPMNAKPGDDVRPRFRTPENDTRLLKFLKTYLADAPVK